MTEEKPDLAALISRAREARRVRGEMTFADVDGETYSAAHRRYVDARIAAEERLREEIER